MAYNQALSIIENLKDQRLIHGDYYHPGSGMSCVFGHLCPSLRKYHSPSPDGWNEDWDLESILERDSDVAEEFAALDMSLGQAQMLQDENDLDHGLRPEERYDHVLRFLIDVVKVSS